MNTTAVPYGAYSSNYPVESDIAGSIHSIGYSVGQSIGGGIVSGVGSYLQGDNFVSIGAKSFLGSQGLGLVAEGASAVQSAAERYLGTTNHSAWNDTLRYGPLIGPIKHYFE